MTRQFPKTIVEGNSISRRSLLKAGFATTVSLSLPSVLRLRAASGGRNAPTAVIFVYLDGGPSQLETYDPKPDAPVEYRGAFQTIPTTVPGVRFCELLPEQAKLMSELAVVRSVTHHEGSHIASHVIECGYFLRNNANILKGEMPAVGSVVARVRGDGQGGLPGFVSLPGPIYYCGPAHLGGRYVPFRVNGDPSSPNFSVANLALGKGLTPGLLADRQALLHSLDVVPRALENDDAAQAIDAFQRQALELITGERARAAFDLDRELPAVRDRYGRTDFGQRMLLARRMVEAGVPFVGVRISPGVKGADWDDHQALPTNMKRRAPIYDRAMAALITDLRERGLSRDVLVVGMGEFGRTPRMNSVAGRDHWPAVNSVVLAGGSYRTGQVVGATDAIGGSVAAAAYAPQSILTMVYRHLGIDPAATFVDHAGRPRYILEEREPIRELL